MIFRQATHNDLDQVMAVIEDGRAALKSLGIDQWQGGSPNRRMIEADIAAGYTYVAAVEEHEADTAAGIAAGDILGTVAYVDTGEPDYDRIVEGKWLFDLPNAATGTPNGPNDPDCPRAPYACLHRCATSSKARRRGVMSFMFESTVSMARARGRLSVRVDTHEGNLPMQRCLEKAGFTACAMITITAVEEPTKLRIGYEHTLL